MREVQVTEDGIKTYLEDNEYEMETTYAKFNDDNKLVLTGKETVKYSLAVVVEMEHPLLPDGRLFMSHMPVDGATPEILERNISNFRDSLTKNVRQSATLLDRVGYEEFSKQVKSRKNEKS